MSGACFRLVMDLEKTSLYWYNKMELNSKHVFTPQIGF